MEKNIWQYRSLSDPQQQRVRDCIQVMVAEKTWEGIDGFQVTDAVKVTIAGAASLLTLGLSKPFFFDRVETIIVYPQAIKNRQIQRGYVVDESESYFSGIAWQNGPLLFSWANVLAGTRHPGDGFNVVIHEFAHHIDGLDGEMGGMPVIDSAELQQRWEQVFPQELQRLRAAIDGGQRAYLDPYAATDPAEFFAVTTENFFDSPQRLKQVLPDVFEILRQFFGVDADRFEFR